ncbi:MAG: threonine synthase [Candidatus Eisenbacteria sp.]|nr:threonine synthase [Candidatus Eisenbacteria bacterium]
MVEFSFVKCLRCVTCGAEYEIDESVHTCSTCGPLLGTLDVLYDTDRLAASFGPDILKERTDPTIWRYHEILPIRDRSAPVAIPVGMTPLYSLDSALGFNAPKRLLIKDDTRHPSGSTKDRATAVAMARAREVGVSSVAAASTGNAASSLATFAARADLACCIFAPATAPAAKLLQIRAHGATLLAIEGTYDQAFDLCMATCERLGFYNRNTAVNPFLSEGKKTIALEIWEQLGFRAPDVIVVPVGDGCIVGGVYKGFCDLLDLELIPRIPRIIGVQASGSSALAVAWREGLERCKPSQASTLADSICVSHPRDQIKALRAIRESDGLFITVDDQAILEALSILASKAGILVEPAAAAPLAGLKEALAKGQIESDAEVVLLHTGHGLKDIDALQKASAGNRPLSVKPDLEEVAEALTKKRVKDAGQNG